MRLFLGIVSWPLIAGSAWGETYTFGVLSQRSAVLTAQYWNPILDYVEKKSGVRLVLKAARTAPESNDATERGEYDFVYSNTIFQPRMVVGHDELDAMKPAGKQTLQEAPPVDLGFARGHRATEHPALARSLDADGDQHGAIMDAAFQTHLLASAAAYAA